MEYLYNLSHLLILLLSLGDFDLWHFSARRPSTRKSKLLVISNPQVSTRQYLVKRLRVTQHITAVVKVGKALMCRDMHLSSI